jgi:hypothetical protein
MESAQRSCHDLRLKQMALEGDRGSALASSGKEMHHIAGLFPFDAQIQSLVQM